MSGEGCAAIKGKLAQKTGELHPNVCNPPALATLSTTAAANNPDFDPYPVIQTT